MTRPLLLAQKTKFMPVFTYNSTGIFYRSSGRGQPLVLLHGFCEDHSVWEFLYDYNLQGQLIVIDLPGFGQSERAARADLMEMADGVAALLKHLDSQNVILIGHSMGGYVSLAFAEKYGSLLSGLGLVHSSPYADTDAKKEKRQKEIAFIDRHGPAPYVAELLPKLFPSGFAEKAMIQQLIKKTQQYTPEGIQSGLKAMMKRPDRSQVLQEIGCPVLVLAGGKDIVVPIEKSLAFAHLPDRVSMHFLPDVAHMGMFESPTRCREIIVEFIRFCQ